MNEKEASQLLRKIIHDISSDTTQEEERTALAYLDMLERNYLDTKAQRDEDTHPALVKLISLDGTAASTRITFAGVNVRNVTRAVLDMDAGRRSHPGILRTKSIDETRLNRKTAGIVAGAFPYVDGEIPLASFVFRGVRL